MPTRPANSTTLVNPYTTVDRVQDELRNHKPEIMRKLIRAINDASDWIDDFTNRDFVFHDFTGTPWNEGRMDGPYIFLPWPCITLEKIWFPEQEEQGLDLKRVFIQENMLDLTDVRDRWDGFGMEINGGGDQNDSIGWFDSMQALGRDKLRDHSNLRFARWVPKVWGTFGYLPAVQPATICQDGQQVANPNAGQPDPTQPPQGLPMKVVRACTLIAAALSGEYRIERVGIDGSRVDIASTYVPKEAQAMLKKYVYNPYPIS